MTAATHQRVSISVITPSFNQGDFLARTIESVLAQAGDVDLEYLVMDGGSRDATPDILRSYGDRLTWVSEPDGGQSDAINKGFRHARGDVLAWLNSDDTYAAGALAAVAEVFRDPAVRWCFGDCRVVDEHDREIRRAVTRYKQAEARRYSFRRLLRRDFIAQPATFFRRDALRAVGPVDRTLHYAMDYDLWLRLGRLAAPRYLPRTLAAFRWHSASKNGARYRRAAWETFQTAGRHARGIERLDLACHAAHVMALCAVYPLLALHERTMARQNNPLDREKP